MLKSWMVIGGVALVVALLGGTLTPKDQWFYRLRRPQWLTFEGAIPFIWTFILICGVWSAYLVWEADPSSQKSWWLMGLYLLVELAIMAYTLVMFSVRSLMVGVVLGATGTLLGAILAWFVLPISAWAFALLLPYLIWSPIGTYVTWAMIHLNPGNA
jgi:benzodiazapine receptor